MRKRFELFRSTRSGEGDGFDNVIWNDPYPRVVRLGVCIACWSWRAVNESGCLFSVVGSFELLYLQWQALAVLEDHTIEKKTPIASHTTLFFWYGRASSRANMMD